MNADAPRLLHIPGPATWQVPSNTRPDIVYHVTRRRHGGLTCTCTAAAFGRRCRHRLAVFRLLEEQMTVTSIDRPKNGPPATPDIDPAALEALLGQGDLGKLSTEQRTNYYRKLCESLGLNPLSLPFRYISFNADERGGGGLALYACKGATDQLRKLHGVSIALMEIEQKDDIFRVTAHASTKDGRLDQDIGAVSIRGLSGQQLANAIKRCVTQAKRRATLSICGLGWLDESEVDDIPTERIVPVNPQTGDVLQPRTGLPVTAAAISGKPEPEQRRAVPKAPPPATNMTTWWQTLRQAGWDAPIIQQAAQATFGRQVQNLDGDQLTMLHEAALSGRLQANAEGEWRVVPVGQDEPTEEGTSEAI